MSFTESSQLTQHRYPGDGWFMKEQDKTIWLTMMDADRWKSWEHDRWMTTPGKAGALYLFGGSDPSLVKEDRRRHMAYAKHLCSEVEVEDMKRGAMVRRWKNKSKTNHYLDASYMADVAANIRGIKLLGQQPAPPPEAPPQLPVRQPEFSDGTPFLASAR